jgi:HK97 family phage prohead protease
MPINTKDREYREINVTALEVREEQDGKKIVEGYATVFDQEYRLWGDDRFQVMESVDRRAFDEADMKDVIMQYDHEGRVFARISNGTLELKADEHGLKIRADLSGTEIGRQLYEEIRGGYTTKMSFGFKVKKEERTEERNAETGSITVHRKITEIKKLYDVSAVSIPANDATEISARNISEGVIAEVQQELLAIEARKRKKTQIAITADMI